VTVADGAVLGLVGLFVAWGTWRGASRPATALVLLAIALAVAGAFGERLAGTVGKVSSLGPHGRCLAAWGATFFVVFLAGSALVAFVRRGKARPARGRFPLLGALLGLIEGVVVAVLGIYAAIAWHDGGFRPGFVAQLERGITAPWARSGATALRRVLPLPECVEAEARRVDARIP
jgi:hypothetical protein